MLPKVNIITYILWELIRTLKLYVNIKLNLQIREPRFTCPLCSLLNGPFHTNWCIRIVLINWLFPSKVWSSSDNNLTKFSVGFIMNVKIAFSLKNYNTFLLLFRQIFNSSLLFDKLDQIFQPSRSVLWDQILPSFLVRLLKS